jgi:hypothetical protein
MINFQVAKGTVTDNNISTSIKVSVTKTRSVLLTKYFSGDKITNNKVCGVRGTYGKQVRCARCGHLRETGEMCGVWALTVNR